MRTLARIFFGAIVGLIAALVLLIALIFVLEALYTRGLRYDDMTLAWFSWGVLMSAPIVGGWWGWVRS